MRCCSTSPGSTGYWFGFFFLFYGAALLATELWPALEAFERPLLLTALGAACLANAAWSRTYHCLVTGPLFLVLAAIAALDAAGAVSVSDSLLWGLALMGVGGAFLLEHHYAT